MKLKTKFQDEDFELGEVVEGVIVECLGKHEEELRVIATAAKGGQHTFYYSSIKKFMDDWEDYEEPKGIRSISVSYGDKRITIEFSTREETVEAYEKLTAWKRLKDKGFEFEYAGKYENLCGNGFEIPIRAIMPPENYTDAEVGKDLDLLFGRLGGEE